MSNHAYLLKTLQRFPISHRVKAIVIGLQDLEIIFPTPRTPVASLSSFLMVSMVLTSHSHTGLIALQQTFRKSPTLGPLLLLFPLLRAPYAHVCTWLASHLGKEIDIVSSLVGLIV